MSVRNAFHSAYQLHGSALSALTGPKFLWAENAPVPTEASTLCSHCADCLLGVATTCLRGSVAGFFRGGLKMALAFASLGSWCRELEYQKHLLTLPAVASLKKNAREIQILFLLFGIIWLASERGCIVWSVWPENTSGLTTVPSVFPGEMSQGTWEEDGVTWKTVMCCEDG